MAWKATGSRERLRIDVDDGGGVGPAHVPARSRTGRAGRRRPRRLLGLDQQVAPRSGRAAGRAAPGPSSDIPASAGSHRRLQCGGDALARRRWTAPRRAAAPAAGTAGSRARGGARAHPPGTQAPRAGRRARPARSSGSHAWTITRPRGSPGRPGRPESWVRRRKRPLLGAEVGHGQRLSASSTAASFTPGTSWPLATICVPTSTAPSAARNRAGWPPARPAGRRRRRRAAAPRAAESARRGRARRASSGSDLRQVDRPARRARPRHRLGRSRSGGSAGARPWSDERDVAARAAPRAGARPAVQRRGGAPPVLEHDRAAAAVLDLAERVEQRPRERVAAVQAQVDDLDPRQAARRPALAGSAGADRRATSPGAGVALP